jgi:hypothetical protein
MLKHFRKFGFSAGTLFSLSAVTLAVGVFVHSARLEARLERAESLQRATFEAVALDLSRKAGPEQARLLLAQSDDSVINQGSAFPTSAFATQEWVLQQIDLLRQEFNAKLADISGANGRLVCVFPISGRYELNDSKLVPTTTLLQQPHGPSYPLDWLQQQYADKGFQAFPRADGGGWQYCGFVSG